MRSSFTTARKKLANRNVHVLSLPDVKQPKQPQHRGFAGTAHRNSITTTTMIGAKPLPLQSQQTQQQSQQQPTPTRKNNSSYLAILQRSPTFILALGAMMDHLTRCDCTFQHVAPMWNDPTNDTLKVAYRHHTMKKQQPQQRQKQQQQQHYRKQ